MFNPPSRVQINALSTSRNSCLRSQGEPGGRTPPGVLEIRGKASWNGKMLTWFISKLF